MPLKIGDHVEFILDKSGDWVKGQIESEYVMNRKLYYIIEGKDANHMISVELVRPITATFEKGNPNSTFVGGK